MSATKSKTKTKPFDPAEYLDAPRAIAAYLTNALETGNPSFIADALVVIARARATPEIAQPLTPPLDTRATIKP